MTNTATMTSITQKWMALGMILIFAAACTPSAHYSHNYGRGYDSGIRLSAHEPYSSPSKAGIGSLAGAAAGAIAGSNVGKGKGRVAAIAVGTLLGAMLGKEVGASLDRADRAYMQQASYQSLESSPSGVTSSWVNPDTGHNGTITPVRTYQNNGRYCREYNQMIQIGGQTQQGYGTACRMPDGSWETQS